MNDVARNYTEKVMILGKDHGALPLEQNIPDYQNILDEYIGTITDHAKIKKIISDGGGLIANQGPIDSNVVRYEINGTEVDMKINIKEIRQHDSDSYTFISAELKFNSEIAFGNAKDIYDQAKNEATKLIDNLARIIYGEYDVVNAPSVCLNILGVDAEQHSLTGLFNGGFHVDDGCRYEKLNDVAKDFIDIHSDLMTIHGEIPDDMETRNRIIYHDDTEQVNRKGTLISIFTPDIESYTFTMTGLLDTSQPYNLNDIIAAASGNKIRT